MIKYLVERGADINAETCQKLNVLHAAAEGGNLQVVKYLIELGVDINAVTIGGETLLHYSARRGHFELVKYFMEKGLGVNAKATKDETPLYLAARWGHFEVLKCLIERGVDINVKTKNGDTLLHGAAEGGNLEVIDYLIEQGADLEARNVDNSTPLYLAAKNNRLEVVKYLVEKGADIEVRNESDYTPLHIAVQNGSFEVVKYLVEQGANIKTEDETDYTPLDIAAEKGDLRTAKFLVEKGATIEYCVNDKGDTLLHLAASLGDLELIQLLLEKGVDINSVNENNGFTPLHLAAKCGQVETVKFLVKKGADINSMDHNDLTALDVAIEQNNSLLILFLSSIEGEMNLDDLNIINKLKANVRSLVNEKGCSFLEKALGLSNILNSLLEWGQSGEETKFLFKVIVPVISQAIGSIVKSKELILKKKCDLVKLEDSIKTLVYYAPPELSEALNNRLDFIKKAIEKSDKGLSNTSCKAFEKMPKGFVDFPKYDAGVIQHDLETGKPLWVKDHIAKDSSIIKSITSFLGSEDYGRLLISSNLKAKKLNQISTHSNKRLIDLESANSEGAITKSPKMSIEGVSDGVAKMDIETVGNTLSDHVDTNG